MVSIMFLFGQFRELSKPQRSQGIPEVSFTPTLHEHQPAAGKKEWRHLGSSLGVFEVVKSCNCLHRRFFLELSTSQVLVVLFVVAFCYDFKLWRHYDYDILWPFLKGFPYSWSVCHCCKRHVFFPREVTGHHRGSTDVEAVKMLSKPAFACRGIESQICLETQWVVIFLDSFPLKTNYVYIHFLQLYMNI